MYLPIKLEQQIEVTHLVTVHYFEYAKDFYFAGEAHNFWEFLYVDKGRVWVQANHQRHLLKQGDLIIHAPNEFHTVECDGKIAPNLIVVSFVATGSLLSMLSEQIFKADNRTKQLLSEIIHESSGAFSSDLADPLLKELKRKSNAKLGSEQLVYGSLNALLIHLMRRTIDKTITESALLEPTSSIAVGTLDYQIECIESYILSHLHERITLSSLSRHTLLSPSTLSRAVKKRHHMSVMALVVKHKMDVAKARIREGQQSFGQLAESLGYISVNHFGRAFKQQFDMTLSEYAKRIKR